MVLDPTKDPNYSFRVRLGEPVNILLSERPSDLIPVSDIKKDQDVFIRRPKRRMRARGKKRSDFYMQFYDLGSLVEGTPRSTGIDVDSIDLDTLRDFYNWPLSIDPADWKDTFTRLTKTQAGYRLRVELHDDGDPINTGTEEIGPDNPKWSDKGYKISKGFDSISTGGDVGYLFEQSSASAGAISGKRVTSIPDSTGEHVPLPLLDPKNGEIRVFLSPITLKVQADEFIPPPEGGPASPFTESALPNGYAPFSAFCPLSGPPFPSDPDWHRVLVSTSAFSESGDQHHANSTNVDIVERAEALADPIGTDSPSLLEQLEYLSRVMDFEYEVTNYSVAGDYISYVAYDNTSGFINRSWLCYDGEVYPGFNGSVGNQTHYTTNTSSTGPSGPVTFDETYVGGPIPWVDNIPATDLTGEGGALLAAINQGENWFYIWHVDRYFEA